MAVYFVDSWFFIALLYEPDDHHRRALRLARRITGDRLVTHDAVMTEMLAFFSSAGASVRQQAVEIVRRTVAQHHVEPVGRTLFLRGLNRYEARPDKEYSHVDCISMIVMEDYGIRHVLTNDHHFAQAGFTLVNQ